MTNERSLLDAMKDLFSTEEGSLGGKMAAISQAFAEIDRDVQQQVARIGHDMKEKVRAIRRKFYWGMPSMPVPRQDSAPLIRLPTTDSIRQRLEEASRKRNELSQLRVEPLDPSVYKTLDHLARLTDELRDRRVAAHEAPDATEPNAAPDDTDTSPDRSTR